MDWFKGKIYGKSMENLWENHGKSMENHGKSMENHGNIYGFL